jgi:hypothetical protein
MVQFMRAAIGVSGGRDRTQHSVIRGEDIRENGPDLRR